MGPSKEDFWERYWRSGSMHPRQHESPHQIPTVRKMTSIISWPQPSKTKIPNTDGPMVSGHGLHHIQHVVHHCVSSRVGPGLVPTSRDPRAYSIKDASRTTVLYRTQAERSHNLCGIIRNRRFWRYIGVFMRVSAIRNQRRGEGLINGQP